MATPEFGGCQETCALFGAASGSIVRFLGTEQHSRKGEQSKGEQRGADFPTYSPEVWRKVPQALQSRGLWMLGWESQTVEVTALFSLRGDTPTPSKGSLARLSNFKFSTLPPFTGTFCVPSTTQAAWLDGGMAEPLTSWSCPSAQSRDSMSKRSGEAT